jgi:hypothetical protein
MAGLIKKVNYADKRIFIANLRSDWDPFTICDFVGGDVYSNNEIRPYSVFCNWNHWPTALIRSDGRYSSYPDRISHSSLNHIYWEPYREQLDAPAPLVEKVMLEGMSNQKAEDLYPLACSWLSPAAIEPISGISEAVYDAAQKAYCIQTLGSSLSFKLHASVDSPMVNPCFVVHGWKSNDDCRLLLNGEKLRVGTDFRQGVVRDTNGEQTLVVWLRFSSSNEADFTILR